MMDFIGLDVSSTNVGWAQSRNGLVQKCGYEKTTQGKEILSTRVARVFLAVKSILGRLPGQTEVVIEEPFYFRGQLTSMATYSAFGAALASARMIGARTRMVNPSSWHSVFFLGGSGGSGEELKRNIKDRMKMLAPSISQGLNSEDAADAAAMLWAYIESVKSGNPLGKAI